MNDYPNATFGWFVTVNDSVDWLADWFYRGFLNKSERELLAALLALAED